MEYLGPPRGAVNLLKFFATEPDFDTVIGDLSEEFQQQLSAFGQAGARRWYWREALRNGTAFAKRELLRTPVTVLIVTVFIFVALWPVGLIGNQLLVNVRWAWNTCSILALVPSWCGAVSVPGFNCSCRWCVGKLFSEST